MPHGDCGKNSLNPQEEICMIIFGIVCLSIAAAFLYQAIASWWDRRAFPPEGNLVDVGGYRLHMQTAGEAEGPAVVILAGSSNPSVVWAEARAGMGRFVRVVAYDRAGYGWSDSAPGPHTGQQVVQDLHTLLERSQIPGPYLLVGHSLGAMYARLYAQRHPDDVMGLVLVDPYTEGEWRRMPPWVNRSQTRFRRLAESAGPVFCPDLFTYVGGLLHHRALARRFCRVAGGARACGCAPQRTRRSPRSRSLCGAERSHRTRGRQSMVCHEGLPGRASGPVAQLPDDHD